MYGEHDATSLEAILYTSPDIKTVAAVMLRIPSSADPQINRMIRQARVFDVAQQLSIAQLVNSANQKDLHQIMSRNLVIAQQMQATLEKLTTPAS